MALRARVAIPCTVLSTVLTVACGDDGMRDDSAAANPVTSLADPSSAPTTVSEGTTEPTTAPTTAGPGSESQSDATESTAPVTVTDSSTGPDPSATDPDTGETGPEPCAQGEIVCDGTTAQVCDGMGGFSSETPCAKACADGLGCVECVPGSNQCVGQLSQVCKDDGSGWVDGQDCDPVQGLSCDPGTGACLGACASVGSLSYIGCDYYPVVTQQLDAYVGPNNPYAVAVANTTAAEASITVTKGGAQVLVDVVPASSVKVIPLPWVSELAYGVGPSSLVVDGAYRLRSTQPVTVYQFNPVNADVTNDASLLLPVNTWTGNYLVAAWQYWNVGYPGWVSVTAARDGTTVTLKPPKGGVPTQAGGGVDASGNGVVMMNEGDVLQVMNANGGDLTGMIVSADKPLQVLGGHECTQVPIGVTACDHLEDAMFPIEALAKEYIVVPPVQVPNEAAEKAVIVRVVAAEANTTLTFEPDQPVAKVLAAAGDFVEIPTTVAKFVVKADKKILVAEYMVGQDAGYGTSDPAMVIAVPSAQYRTNYLFYAQTGWSANFVDIVAPAGANVTVDGAAVAGFAPIGATGFSLAHVKLSNAGDGSHTLDADQKVGITVYGVLDYGSYWYPGGLDLEVIPQ
jgi:hypothetical protein